jgi:hypothetical protein
VNVYFIILCIIKSKLHNSGQGRQPEIKYTLFSYLSSLLLFSRLSVLDGRLGQTYARDHSQALRPALSEQNCGTHLQVLRTIHESKFDMSFIACSQQILIHFNNLSCLSDHTAMYNCLVVGFDSSCMMQYYYLSLKIVNAVGCRILINQYHALPEVVSLKLVFLCKGLDVEANSLARDCLFHWSSLVMNRFYHYWLETALFVGA